MGLEVTASMNQRIPFLCVDQKQRFVTIPMLDPPLGLELGVCRC